ncbi:MAG: M48 family peptidase [Candidatus Taylorbacteria bacterium]|nr:M48 family peptidase [Candidatus Taylorbacteria bacterium]
MILDFPSFLIKRNRQSRHLRITVKAGGHVTVSAPLRITESAVMSFVVSKGVWLRKTVERFKKIPDTKLSRWQEKRLYTDYKAQAKVLAEKKVFELNKFYKFSFGKIAIRNSRSRWGSCSSKGTLSFNYKIAFLPERLADYLVVHELCHLKEHNHSKNFWQLVAKMIPNHGILRKELRDFEKTFKFPSVGI